MDYQRNSIRRLCITNICLLVISTAMMYWSTFWIVGALLLVIGSIVDVVCLQKQQNYALGWHIFMVIAIPLCVAGMVYYSHDVCYVYANMSYCSPSKCPWLLTECILSSFITGLGVVITIVEIQILIQGTRAGIPTCCCSAQQPATVVLQVPIEQHQSGVENQGFELGLEKSEKVEPKQ